MLKVCVGVERLASIVHQRLIVEHEALVRIQVGRNSRRLVESDGGVEGNLRAALVTTLGGNQHDAVSSLRSVNRSRSSILEDGEGLDLSGVDTQELGLVTLHTVDDVQRLGVVPGTRTADVQCRLVGTGLSGSLHRDEARDTAGDRIRDVRHRRLHDLVSLHRRNRG